jgi:hypothetical protein
MDFSVSYLEIDVVQCADTGEFLCNSAHLQNILAQFLTSFYLGAQTF